MSQLNIGELFSKTVEAKLFENRCVFISEPINAAVAKRANTQLLALDLDDSSAPINLYINSPGGEVNSGFSIFDTIRYINADVRAITSGLCASIATIINIAVKKDNRYSLPNSNFLIHQPLIGGQVQGQASDLEITAREIMKTREKINKLLAEECGQNIDKVTEDTNRDYWMNAHEAVEYGLVSKIISNIKDLG